MLGAVVSVFYLIGHLRYAHYLWRWMRWHEAAERAGQGRCPHCGYDLTGNVSGVCPECGTRFSVIPSE